MADERGTPERERPIARVTVTTDAELLPAVVYFVRQVAHRIGLRDIAAEHLDESVETLCRNVIEQAFGPDEEGQYDIIALHRPGQIVIAVEDQGLPSITLGLETVGTQPYQRCFIVRSLTRFA